MRSTRDVLAHLASSCLAAPVSEEAVRTLIRNGRLQRPAVVAGRYVWSDDDVDRLLSVVEDHKQLGAASHGGDAGVVLASTGAASVGENDRDRIDDNEPGSRE